MIQQRMPTMTTKMTKEKNQQQLQLPKDMATLTTKMWETTIFTAARMCESYHDDDEKEEGKNSPVHMDIIDNHSPGPLSVSQSQWPHKFHLLTSMLRMIWREVSTARVQTNVKH